MKQRGWAVGSACGTGKAIISGSFPHSTVGAVMSAELTVSRNIWAATGLKYHFPGNIRTHVTSREATAEPLWISPVTVTQHYHQHDLLQKSLWLTSILYPWKGHSHGITQISMCEPSLQILIGTKWISGLLKKTGMTLNQAFKMIIMIIRISHHLFIVA